jgi:hypothetical protein
MHDVIWRVAVAERSCSFVSTLEQDEIVAWLGYERTRFGSCRMAGGGSLFRQSNSRGLRVTCNVKRRRVRLVGRGWLTGMGWQMQVQGQGAEVVLLLKQG